MNLMKAMESKAGNACEATETVKLLELLKQLKFSECLRWVKTVKRMIYEKKNMQMQNLWKGLVTQSVQMGGKGESYVIAYLNEN